MNNKKIMRRRSFKHEVITEQILDNIKKKNLIPGDKLPSLRELAKDMNCNYLTVHRSFKELEKMGILEQRIGSGTYVREAAINFTDTKSAKAFNSQITTDRIGLLLIPGAGGPYMNGLLEAMHKIAEEINITLNLRTVSDYGPRNIAQIQSLREQGCCSIIIPWWPGDQDLSKIHKLVNSSMIPVVLPQPLHGLEKNCHKTITSRKHIKHTTISCEYLKALGYKNIALLGVDTETEHNPFPVMIMDYMRFINKSNMDSHIGLIKDTSSREYDLLIERWSHLAGDLAVICYFDEMAIRLMTAIHKYGLKIPKDIAVLGYNNITETEFADPPLSTIQCPYDSIAEEMILHALKLNGDNSHTQKHPFQEKLVIRESCGGKLRAGDKLPALIKSITNTNEEA